MSSLLARHTNLLAAAAENVACNARGYAVAAAGLILGLSLLLSGVAIGEGVKRAALDSVDAGADLYCSWDAFGRDTPIPVERVEQLRQIPGVVDVVPRIVGRAMLADEWAVLVGVPLDRLARHRVPVEGALPRGPAEVLIGAELAQLSGYSAGDSITLTGHSVRVFRISGVVAASASLWSAKAIVCELEEAAILFGERERVSDACVYTRPGYEALAGEAIERIDDRFRVQTRSLVEGYVGRGTTLREGVFSALAALALVLAIPAFAVLTYLGKSPRRREIGLLKAEGWSTADVLEMVALENLIVSLFSAGSALAISLFWVRVLHAPWIGPLFIPELPAFPSMHIPSTFTPLPPLLALIFSITVTMTGSIYTTWRTAITRPVEALR
ncbi:MAG: ABC-type lipoprotein release transport system permease subunit [Chlamydiales bacterium]